MPSDDLALTVGAAFGRKLRAARERAGLTQERLGYLSSTDRAALGKLESGEHKPRLDTIIRLAGALNIEPCELIPATRWQPPIDSEGGYRG